LKEERRKIGIRNKEKEVRITSSSFATKRRKKNYKRV